MLAFYVCPLVTTTTPWGTTPRVGKVYTHRTASERYTVHRGLGELVICSLVDPAPGTVDAIAADQDCIEWPALTRPWADVGQTRRVNLSAVLAAHGVPLAWINSTTTCGEVLRCTLQLGHLRQRGQFEAVAQRSIAPSAEVDLYHEIRRARPPIVVQGVRI